MIHKWALIGWLMAVQYFGDDGQLAATQIIYGYESPEDCARAAVEIANTTEVEGFSMSISCRNDKEPEPARSVGQDT